MSEFKPAKKTYKRILQSKVVLLIIFLIFLFMAKAVYGVYVKNSLAGQNVEKTRVELQGLEEKRDDLAEKLDNVATERGIEEEIRKSFSVAGAGEGVIVVVPGEDESDTAAALPEKKWWQKILFWLD